VSAARRRAARTPAADRTRGSATIFTLALGGLLLAIGIAVGVAASLLLAGSRARTAADLAALAAVDAGAAGRAPCPAAAAVASANGARLVACVPSAGGRVAVVVEVRSRAAGRAARASARAEPGGIAARAAATRRCGPQMPVLRTSRAPPARPAVPTPAARTPAAGR